MLPFPLCIHIMIQNNMFGTEYIVPHKKIKVNQREIFMKRDKNILVAFLLNLTFSALEFIGGIFTGSVAIISDAVHDFGDALSVGISYFLERKSRHKADEFYTYGYRRFSVLGGLITTVILLTASVLVLYNSIKRLLSPTPVYAGGMLLIALLGVIINGAAAYFTHDDSSLNGRAINLHMLEDVLGWAVVLIGAIIIRFTDFFFIDPLLSIGVSVFILHHAIKHLISILRLFLEKVPDNISVAALKKDITETEGVKDLRQTYIRSLDGESHAASIHIVTEGDAANIKKAVREKLQSLGFEYITIETES